MHDADAPLPHRKAKRGEAGQVTSNGVSWTSDEVCIRLKRDDRLVSSPQGYHLIFVSACDWPFGVSH